MNGGLQSQDLINQLGADNSVGVANFSQPGILPQQTVEPFTGAQATDLPPHLAETRSAKIMVVDDEAIVLRVVRRMLTAEGYKNFVTTTDSYQVFEKVHSFKPDVVLMDLMMPNLSGLEILKLRQQDELALHIPFIILTSNSEKPIKREALAWGATEFLSKPVDPTDLAIRVKNSLIVRKHYKHLQNHAASLKQEVEARTRQIDSTCEQVIHCLARAAEFRDNDTGAHVIRVGKIASVLASELGFDSIYCRTIGLAAQLHDVGKIGIPDSILLKPAKLSKSEFDVMKEHCNVGCHIMEPFGENASPFTGRIKSMLSKIESPLLAMAANIALTHHEKWDGTGYPSGLRAEQIPIEGRITCVADVYDALSSARPYKPSFPKEKCLEIMLAERGTRFDPQILDIFFNKLDVIEQIKQQHPDDQTGKS